MCEATDLKICMAVNVNLIAAQTTEITFQMMAGKVLLPNAMQSL